MPPSIDIEKLKALAERLAAEPLTLRQILEHSGISQRTAYRWIDELERRGYDVVRRRTDRGVAFEVLVLPSL